MNLVLEFHARSENCFDNYFSLLQSLYFHKCDQLQLNGITSRDSPKTHVFIHSCNDVRISNVHLNAPENSPNTDGIGISLSTHVTVQDSFIGTGNSNSSFSSSY